MRITCCTNTPRANCPDIGCKPSGEYAALRVEGGFCSNALKCLAVLLLASLLPAQSPAQPPVIVEYDDIFSWTAGSGLLSDFETDHIYVEDNMSFTGGPAIRETAGLQDGFDRTLSGAYAWRLQDASNVQWTGTYALALPPNESLSEFGFSVRRWDSAPSPDFLVEYSFDGGATYTLADNIGQNGIINNAALNNSSDWVNFIQPVNSPPGLGPNRFVVSVTAQGTTERIMIDRFRYRTTTGAPLPITLQNFTATPKANTTHLHWRTAIELNNDYMAIEHSTDGRRYSEIGRVLGAGTTQEPQDYSFVHETPAQGINYYRLRQVDYDGQYEYHGPVTARFGQAAAELHVFPTVSQGELRVRYSGQLQSGAQLSVLGLQGQVQRSLAWDSKSRQRTTLNVSDLPAGLYLLRLQNGREVLSARFVKQ